MTTRSRIACGCLLPALAVLAAGCGDSGSTYGATPTVTTTTTTAPQPASASGGATQGRPDSDGNGVPDPVTVRGALGQALTLEGSGTSRDPADPDNREKTKVAVALTGVTAPITGYHLAADRKLIGVRLRFTNAGRLVYDDPRPDGALTVSGGELGKQTSLISLSGKAECENPSVKLRKGQSKDACLVFDVPKSAKPLTFQYISDHGYGDTGVWKLR